LHLAWSILKIAETARLTIRHLNAGDATFFLRLVNEPSWIANIGDRNLHSVGDAERYIQSNTLASYSEQGFGIYHVELAAGGIPVGVCGLLKRDFLPVPDLGFALLEDQWGRGYAAEAAMAVMNHAFHNLGHARILAIVTPSNSRSMKLLSKLGFEPQGSLARVEENLLLYEWTNPE